jgi:hypothetical protein
MSTVRKLMVPLVLLLLLLVAAPAASAAPQVTTTHETVGGTVTWTLPAGQCADLPAGVWVSGTGERQQEVITKTRADGSSEVLINDLVKGTAIDSSNNTYTFLYHNHSTEDRPPSGSGLAIRVRMNDTFDLNGHGGTRLHVAFTWRWTYTPPAAQWPPVYNVQQLSTQGDPLTCDPI